MGRKGGIDIDDFEKESRVLIGELLKAKAAYEAALKRVQGVVDSLYEIASQDGATTDEEEKAILIFKQKPSEEAFKEALGVIKRSRPRKLARKWAPTVGVGLGVFIILVVLLFVVSLALPGGPASTPSSTPAATRTTAPTAAPPRQVAPVTVPFCKVTEAVPPGAEKFEISDSSVRLVGKWPGLGERAVGRQLTIGDNVYSEVYFPNENTPRGWCQVK